MTYQIDFNNPVHVHFIGIGGISMSGLAEILLDEKFKVSGSDSHVSELTRHLEHMGAVVYYGQKAENISDDTDVVVYTAAIHPDNPEYHAAAVKKIPMLTRAELLGQIMSHYSHSISVSGTHGKTTTTSMITEIFMAAKTDPTVSVGGMLDSIGGNIRVGGSKYFIMEACEYTNSFLSFYPSCTIILNIQPDHLDFFKDLNDIRHSFTEFASNTKEGGTIIINGEIDHYQDILKDIKKSVHVITFGRDKSFDYSYDNVSYDKMGHAGFDLYVKGEKTDHFQLHLEGEHNVMNALAAIAAAHLYGIDNETIKNALDHFGGTHRRFEMKGVFNGVTIIDDYAHHPQEIEATLKAAAHYPHKKLWVVFQPHTYSRTKAFLDQFADALSLADEVVLADIYAARETNTFGVSSQDIVDRLIKKGTPARFISSFEGIEEFFQENCAPGDVLITMGAGDVYKIGDDLLKA